MGTIKSEQYRDSLRRRLSSVHEALSQTEILSRIFDKEWYQEILNHIEKADLSATFRCDAAFMFFTLDHHLRGVPWFEKAQRLLEGGEFERLDEHDRFALGVFGRDPIRAFLPILEQRLSAFAQLPFKQKAVSQKLNELRANRFNRFHFFSHVFEISTLGFFAGEGVLTDIDVPVNGGPSTVDGEIHLDGRPILVEITLATKELLSAEPGVHFGDVESMVDQVVSKVRKKVAEGRQLALARGVPSLLVIGLNPLGSDKITSKWGVDECFANPDFAKLAAIILSSDWKLHRTQLRVAAQPDFPLSSTEVSVLAKWFGE